MIVATSKKILTEIDINIHLNEFELESFIDFLEEYKMQVLYKDNIFKEEDLTIKPHYRGGAHKIYFQFIKALNIE